MLLLHKFGIAGFMRNARSKSLYSRSSITEIGTMSRSRAQAVLHPSSHIHLSRLSAKEGTLSEEQEDLNTEARPLHAECKVFLPLPEDFQDQDSCPTDVDRETSGIEIFLGPMFAGKTTALLQRIAEEEDKGLHVVALKSSKDMRYQHAALATHSGLSRACYALSSLSDFKLKWPQDYKSAEVIAIDEAQFFPDLLHFCSEAADCDGKRLLVAGLDGDFQRQRFGQILDLVPKADAVVKLTSECGYCKQLGLKRAAPFTVRTAADDRQEVVGGADVYSPACRYHFLQLLKLRKSNNPGAGCI